MTALIRLPDPTQVPDPTTKDYIQQLVRALTSNFNSVNNASGNVFNSTANTLAGFNTNGVFSDVTIGANLSLVAGVLSGTVSPPTGAANTLAGYDNTGAFADVTIGSNLSLIGGVLAASTSSGTVTSVDASGSQGVTVSGGPITTSGSLTIGLGNITPITVNGNTITTGSGTLTLGSNTLTVSNTLTLTGTNGSTINLSNGQKRYIGFSTLSPVVQQQGTYVTVPFAGTIAAWSIGVDVGTATVKVWKIATGTATPTSANSINTSGVSLSSNTYKRSTDVTDFTSTTVTANDIFGFEITAVSASTTRIAFELEITAS